MSPKKQQETEVQKSEVQEVEVQEPEQTKEVEKEEETEKRVIVPQGKRTPKMDISRAKILLYGPPKIGKTTLATKFPGAWFFATEQGQDWVELYEPTIVESWEQFLDLCAYIEETRPTHFGDGTPICTLVFDTVELLFKLCNDYMCDTLGVASMSDLEWGKGWNALNDEFLRVMTKISRWPYGLIFICHSKEQEIKSKSTKIDRIQPSIMTTGLRIVQTLSDFIFYCFMNEVPEMNEAGEITGRIIEERVIQCQPKNNIIAGDRTGKLPPTIPMHYEELLKYFPATPGKESK